MKRPPDVIQRGWGVYLLKRKADRLPFTVTARDSEEAIKRAIEEHDIPDAGTLPHQRSARGLTFTRCTRATGRH